MPFLQALALRTPKTLIGVLVFFWKVKFWLFLILVLSPTLIDSIQFATETKNPLYPFSQLGLRIFSADNDIQKVVNLMNEDPRLVIGVNKPSMGIWKHTVYYWKYFINFIWRILGDIYLIFLPLYVIYRLLRPRNISEPLKNWTRATFWFLIYLFIMNTIIFTHGIIVGNTIVIIPENFDTYKEYFLIFLHLLPFHGLASLVQYTFQGLANS